MLTRICIPRACIAINHLARTRQSNTSPSVGAWRSTRPRDGCGSSAGTARAGISRRSRSDGKPSRIVNALSPSSAGASIVATAGPILLLPFVQLGVAGMVLRGNVLGTKVIGENGKALHVLTNNLNHTRGGSTGIIKKAADFIAESEDPRHAIAAVAKIAEARTGDFEEIAADFARAPRGRTMKEAVDGMMRKQVRASRLQTYSGTRLARGGRDCGDCGQALRPEPLYRDDE